MKQTILCLVLIIFFSSSSNEARWIYSEDSNQNQVLLVSYESSSNEPGKKFSTYHRMVYNEDGQIDTIEKYDSGRLIYLWDEVDFSNADGYNKSYYRNGNIEYEGIMIDGKKNGVWNNYSRDGHILTSRTFINGQPNGYWIDYNHNEDIDNILCNGLKFWDGKMMEFHSNGNKTRDMYISDGRLDGVFTVYYYQKENSDKINIKGAYSKGMKDGKWIWYSQKGKTTKYETYANGIKDGKWVSFYNGTDIIKFNGEYVNDQRVGLWEWFDEESNLVKSIQY